jgi:hypothetical protein
MDGVYTTCRRCPLRHDVASDVGVLIQYPPHNTHRGKQPQALLDTVLEINNPLHIVTKKFCCAVPIIYHCAPEESEENRIPGDIFVVFIFLTKNSVHLLMAFLLMFRMGGQVVESPCYTCIILVHELRIRWFQLMHLHMWNTCRYMCGKARKMYH